MATILGKQSDRRHFKNQACTACRRSKVRCESIEDGAITVLPMTRCRRCRTINQSCSFEKSGPAIGSSIAPGNLSSAIPHSPASIRFPDATFSSEHGAASATRRLQSASSDDPGHMEVPWGMLRIGELDCLAVPVLALHIAMRTDQSDGSLSRGSPGESLTAILSEAQITQLTDM
jgi:hypothetical protein